MFFYVDKFHDLTILFVCKPELLFSIIWAWPVIHGSLGMDLHRKTFTATAATAGVGIAEMKPFAIEAVRKIEGGIAQV